MQMTDEMFSRYRSGNPLEMDAEIRECFKIPDNRYYTVGISPDHAKGVVTVTNLVRSVQSRKISKSDSPQ